MKVTLQLLQRTNYTFDVHPDQLQELLRTAQEDDIIVAVATYPNVSYKEENEIIILEAKG